MGGGGGGGGSYTGGATVMVICWTWPWLLYVLCSSSSWPAEAPVNWCGSWSRTRTKNSCGPPPASSRCCPCAPATNPRLWRLVSSYEDRRMYSCWCSVVTGRLVSSYKDRRMYSCPCRQNSWSPFLTLEVFFWLQWLSGWKRLSHCLQGWKGWA